jgi:hypothetical protein
MSEPSSNVMPRVVRYLSLPSSFCITWSFTIRAFLTLHGPTVWRQRSTIHSCDGWLFHHMGQNCRGGSLNCCQVCSAWISYIFNVSNMYWYVYNTSQFKNTPAFLILLNTVRIRQKTTYSTSSTLNTLILLRLRHPDCYILFYIFFFFFELHFF